MPDERQDVLAWQPGGLLSLGVEEELVLVDARSYELAPQIERVLPALPAGVRGQVSADTHACALELKTAPTDTAADAVVQLAVLRAHADTVLRSMGLRAVGTGLHPSALWWDVRVSAAERYRRMRRSMRELICREPTFALHVHVGVDDPDQAVRLMNRLRVHLPLLLALSANSPFWQGRDSGLACARLPAFDAFPRTGIPRRFDSFAAWQRMVRTLMRCGAIADHTHLWWDVRLEPQLGTVEVRIMDTQLSVSDNLPLVALVQSLSRLELQDGFAPEGVPDELLEENRFRACRDGRRCELIDPRSGQLRHVADVASEMVDACAPHAAELGCTAELEQTAALLADGGADRQRRWAGDPPSLEMLGEALVAATLQPLDAAVLVG